MSMSKHSERFFRNLATSERYSNKSVCLKKGVSVRSQKFAI